VTIAGAGVLGLSAALALADAGCRVTVCDPAGANASAVAAGMIAPAFEAVLDPSARPHLDLLMAARDLWPALAVRAGIALDRSGAMAVGDDAWLGQVAATFGRLGLRPTEISGRTARALTPGLASAFDRALLCREDWRVDAPAALQALRDAAEAAGVAFRPWRVGDRGNADVLVAATGADLGLADLVPELGALAPIKGQIVRLKTQGPGGVTVRAEGLYVAPAGHELIVGATMEPGLSDSDVDLEKVRPLLDGAMRLFPDLGEPQFWVGAGVRAATPDGLPLAGPSATPGVIVAAGARRNGWLLAPLTAQVVTACVTGRDAGPYAARLDPARRS